MGAGASRPPVQDTVSAAVKRSLHAREFALRAAKSLTETAADRAPAARRPDLVERYSEALAWLTLDDPQLDRLRQELLNLAASGGKP